MPLDSATYLTDRERLRGDVNDVEAIMALTNRDMEAELSSVQSHYDALFTWDYRKAERPALNKLYEKAKGSQWDGEKDLDWTIEVDEEKTARQLLSVAPGDGWIRDRAQEEGLFKG